MKYKTYISALERAGRKKVELDTAKAAQQDAETEEKVDNDVAAPATVDPVHGELERE